MLLFDGHLDLAMNAVLWNRDLTLPVHETRHLEAGMTQKGRAAGTVSFGSMRQGEVFLCIATVIARVARQGNPLPGYCSAEVAYAQAQGQLAYYRMMERQGVLRLIADRASLDSHLRDWEVRPNSAPLGLILTMEGADPVVYPEQVHEWRDQGLRWPPR